VTSEGDAQVDSLLCTSARTTQSAVWQNVSRKGLVTVSSRHEPQAPGYPCWVGQAALPPLP
jgi:hypothetical protein